jgi:peptidoglycan hydrolase CwlO-like protein
MLNRLVKSLLLLLAILLVAGLMAGCAANLPCTVGEDQVEQARAKAGSADKQLQQTNQKVADLEAQAQSKQAAADELKAKKAALEEELKKAGGHDIGQ